MTRDEIEELFRRNLRQLREENGFSQRDLARRLGICSSYICDFEKGRRSPTIRTLAPLAEVLGVSPSALVSAVGTKLARRTLLAS